MKLARVGEPGLEKPAIIHTDGSIRDLSNVVRDISGQTLTPEGLQSLRSVDTGSLPLVDSDIRYGPCVDGVGKFICIGLNYADHAAEAGLPLPVEPVVFLKATSAICGPNDTVLIPRGSTKTDWEIELGVVIGTGGKYIDEIDALNHVAGYCVVNDISE